jgi:DNA-binding transcriptional LysR family regulator
MTGKEFTSFDWDDLRHFLALARAGSLLGASRLIGVEHATVSRRIQALEERLGRKLVDRRGRRVHLTEEGEAVARHADLMASHMAAIAQRGRSSATLIKGRVRISAPPALSCALLAEPVANLRAAHPGIHITLVGEKRTASLDRREADIAVRLSRPETGDYTITKLGEIAFGLYASKTYIETVDPAHWTFIGYDDDMNTSPQQVRLREIAGDRPMPLTSSLLEFQAEAARLGSGVVMLPEFLVSSRDTLERVAMDTPLAREVWLVVHSDIRAVPSIRAVSDAVIQAFRDRAPEPGE